MKEVVSLPERDRDEVWRYWICKRGNILKDEVDGVGREGIHDGRDANWICTMYWGNVTPLIRHPPS